MPTSICIFTSILITKKLLINLAYKWKKKENNTWISMSIISLFFDCNWCIFWTQTHKISLQSKRNWILEVKNKVKSKFKDEFLYLNPPKTIQKTMLSFLLEQRKNEREGNKRNIRERNEKYVKMKWNIQGVSIA